MRGEAKRIKRDNPNPVPRIREIEITMATAALPIRELSANVEYEAASAQKAFWEVVESRRRQAYFNLAVWYLTRKLDCRMARLVEGERNLIEHLRKIPIETMSGLDFSKVADDLNRIVSTTNAILADSYEMPERCIAVWRLNLETVGDLSTHLESFAEAFRTAADESCTALFADIAKKVAVGEKVSA